ncbi:hypothetical protein RclHR1_06060006 [Rhizophagus clarus]|uniref:C2H2-type zinc finger transcription factor n=1 Tax=Rhizophagus clarus TaxID=94130 RepID=A0A2Z6RQ28_9GLOM|nr:hypothetical protein RclHR1_06060006 [Rhizophagus clarus]GES88928.1 C2H2-type zinc finger transcription factor [Rhizophagus clarus]
MNKLNTFILDAKFCRPYSGISEFFSTTSLIRWNNIEKFARLIYTKNPTVTAQQVLDHYIQSLIDITTINNLNPKIAQHAHNLHKRIIKTEYLKIIGDTLLEIIQNDAKQRRRKTSQTRKEFQSAGEDDIENRKTAGYINSYSLNDEIGTFFQSNPEQKSIKKRRKSSNKRDISNELVNVKDEAESEAQNFTSISEDNDDSDYIHISEDDDDSDYIQSDVEDQSPPPLLLSSQLKNFRESYEKMNASQKWVLSSKKCVEDAIFEYCKQQPSESYLHSWIIDLDDQEVEKLFDVEELNEIRYAVRELPKVDRAFAESMMRFSDVKTTSELRQVLKMTSFLNEDESYNREKHYDAEWAEIVMRKFLTDYEDPNEPLQKQHLESWFDINVWSLIVDHGLRNVTRMETVRKESSSEAVSMRKNRKRSNTRRKKVGRKKMGYRMDGIFRMYVDNVEYGAIEVAKKFEETKLLADGYKLGKAMHDILLYLSRKVNFEETKIRKLRVAGMLHLGLKSQVLHLSSPKGYVSILKREKLLEVPATIKKLRDLIRVLASVWMLKKIVTDCVETVNMRVQNKDEFLQEVVRMGTESPPLTVVLPWSCNTK